MQPERTSLASVRVLQPGFVLGRYIVVDRIGAGGMAELYLARVDGPPRFAKPVALKLLHRHLVDDPEFVRMFEKEARIAATLDHPNIVQVLDVGQCGPDSFLALEYVHGRDLRRIVTAGGPLPYGCALRVVADVARALHDAHHRRDTNDRPLGIVHRDVSPANILVAFSGAVKLADFGVAKASEHTQQTQTASLKGKFGYMAPEQYLQEPLDGRSDLYALGIVLYEITTGRRAFKGDQTFSIMNKVLAGEIDPPTSVVHGYPPRVEELVQWAMALDRDDRPPTAGAFADAIEQVAAELGLDAHTETLAEEVRARFGDPAPPPLDVEPLRPATESSPRVSVVASSPEPVDVPRSRVRRTVVVAALVAAGVGVGGLFGWSAAQSEPSLVDDTVPAARANPPVIDAPRDDAPSRTAAAEAPVAAPELPPHVESTPPPSEAATPATQPSKKSKPIRKQAPRKRAKAADEPRAKPLEPRDGMFPKGMQ